MLATQKQFITGFFSNNSNNNNDSIKKGRELVAQNYLYHLENQREYKVYTMYII